MVSNTLYSFGVPRVAGAGVRPAHHRERADVELEDLVAVHAGDVDARACVIHLHAMRHVARRNIRDTGHRGRINHGDDVDARVIAVKV